jgi:L-asparaginase/Glu-tRNA(Gln) amidotransferase subunit D/CheY-like chemotaxis protein
MNRSFVILIVDAGYPKYREVLVKRFKTKRKEWRFLFAGDKKAASEILDESPCDMVVLDTSLSKKGQIWLSFLRHIREKYPLIPMILMTGSKNSQLMQDAFITMATGEDLTVGEVGPEGFIFKEEVFKDDNFELLEKEISRGLHKFGRVENRTGVLITHGTDTLAWVLAYLRYSLSGLTANVAVTGSQVPLEGTFFPSDAIGNLRTAVFLLAKLRPSHLFAVFNNGKQVFSGRLIKYRKWDPEAFEGRLAASVEHEGIKIVRDDWVFIPYEEQKLETLHLLRTGGTIESKKNKGGSLSPKGDFVSSYLSSSLSKYFKKLSKQDLFALDSSNISYEEWDKLSRTIESLGICSVDSNFEKGVKPIFVNPLFTTADYKTLFSLCKQGAILLGYGGGNANVQDDSFRSILPALKDAIKKGMFIAVTSQIPLESYDAEYESGRRLLEVGGIPCGDLSVADAQVKLSYILGHRDAIRKASKEAKLDEKLVLVSSFLSGTTLFKSQSEELQKRFTREGKGLIRLLPYDPFVPRTFEEGLKRVIKALKEI